MENENYNPELILDLIDQDTALEVYSGLLISKKSMKIHKYLKNKDYLSLLDIHSKFHQNYDLNKTDRRIVIDICTLTKWFIEKKKAEELTKNGELIIGEYEADGKRTYANLWYLGELLIAVEPFETTDGTDIKYSNRFFVNPYEVGSAYNVYIGG